MGRYDVEETGGDFLDCFLAESSAWSFEGWVFDGRPEMTGGGRSRPSAALAVSCLEKSEACHHSRNLRAKMDVGRRMRSDDSRRG